MKNILMALLALLLLYLVVGLFLYLRQRYFLYYPTPKIIAAHYKNIFLENENEKINIIVLNEGHGNAILYFGGNAESMAESADYIAGQFPDFTVYLMDYRGYGLSTGEASEEALFSDALNLYDMVKEKHARISVGGRSLGTAVAAYVAANREVSKLALITPFDSIVNVAQDRYPIYPVRLLLRDKYDTVGRVKQIKAKTFIVSAQNDEVIPWERTEAFIKAFYPEQLETAVIENRGHSDISSDERYYRIMQAFIGEG